MSIIYLLSRKDFLEIKYFKVKNLRISENLILENRCDFFFLFLLMSFAASEINHHFKPFQEKFSKIQSFNARNFKVKSEPISELHRILSCFTVRIIAVRTV